MTAEDTLSSSYLNPLSTYSMKKSLIIVSFAALTMHAQTTSKQPFASLLPTPKQITTGQGSFRLDSPYRLEVASALKDAPALATTAWNGSHADAACQRVVSIRNEASKDSRLTAEQAEEYYRLHVSADTILVYAKTLAGVNHALATLDQLRQGSSIPACDIADYPTYPWRGCHIDISRHFFPLSFLKKQVDVLAHYKINRLHLHLTDAGGWRMQIDRYPLLTQLAGWRTESDWTKWWIDNDRRYLTEGTPGAYGGYYTKDELRELVRYATLRGIDVIPEIEMPGHSEEVTTAYPELKCEGNNEAQGDVCPSNEQSYAFFCNILDEVMEVFPSQYVHIGGDEAGKDAWKKCPRCQRRAKLLGFDNTNDLQGFLIQRMTAYLRLYGKQAIGWDEVIDDKLTPAMPTLGENMNVMVWRDLTQATLAMQRGHNVILTPGDYYLNRAQDDPTTGLSKGDSYLPLHDVWLFDPAKFNDPALKGRVLGVQGNLWTENIATTDYAEYMLYPRELVIAETGWNGKAADYGTLRTTVQAQSKWLSQNDVHAFDLTKERGNRKESLQPVKHLAIGAKVTYNQKVSPRYTGSGDGTLTDGLRGGWSNNDGRWQGFCQTSDTTVAPFDVTVDLGKVKTFRSVALDFMQNDNPWIYYPERFTILTSDDGEHFTPLYQHNEDNTRLSCVAVRTWQWTGKASARYIRIQARCLTAGKWVFTDEIKVK